MDYIDLFLDGIKCHQLICICLYIIVLDVIFGILRATKEKGINSCVGIDGLIRKASMIVTLVFLFPVDMVMSVNLVGFLPEDVLELVGISSVGLADFFALLFIAFEIVSVLKNMALCGLPVKKVWETVYNFLRNYTDELPDAEEVER